MHDGLTAEMNSEIRPFAPLLVEQHFNYLEKVGFQDATRQMSASNG